MTASRRVRLYDNAGVPVPDFNRHVLDWLTGASAVFEHAVLQAFNPLREVYETTLCAAQEASDKAPPRWEMHRTMLSNLTNLMLDFDIAPHLAERLASEPINERGFRTALAQGQAKNTGENFVNAMCYALADSLAHQDEVLVDKGLAKPLKEMLTLEKQFHGSRSGDRAMHIPIEVDLSIFSRSDPSTAIIVSAKTRLKEIFHIGTMWKLFYDMINDQHSLEKWGLTSHGPNLNMLYVFATADMIPTGGARTQGPDVERCHVRNLIALDASFFDYVFVSKEGIPHVSNSLNLSKGRETLFHELGCLLDLVEQKFGSTGFSFI